MSGFNKYCDVCGDTWGSYDTHREQHYCRDGRRVVRDAPTETQREQQDRKDSNDPYQAHEDARAAWRLRHRQ